jgi:hypothetical protein
MLSNQRESHQSTQTVEKMADLQAMKDREIVDQRERESMASAARQRRSENGTGFSKPEWCGLVGGQRSPVRSRNTSHSLLLESREKLSSESHEKKISSITSLKLEARLVSILIFFNFNWKETSYSKNITRRSDIAFGEKKMCEILRNLKYTMVTSGVWQSPIGHESSLISIISLKIMQSKKILDTIESCRACVISEVPFDLIANINCIK